MVGSKFLLATVAAGLAVSIYVDMPPALDTGIMLLWFFSYFKTYLVLKTYILQVILLIYVNKLITGSKALCHVHLRAIR